MAEICAWSVFTSLCSTVIGACIRASNWLTIALISAELNRLETEVLIASTLSSSDRLLQFTHRHAGNPGGEAGRQAPAPDGLVSHGRRDKNACWREVELFSAATPDCAWIWLSVSFELTAGMLASCTTPSPFCRLVLVVARLFSVACNRCCVAPS